MKSWPNWLNEDGAFRILSHDIVSSDDDVIVCDEIAEVNGKKRWRGTSTLYHPRSGIEEIYIEEPTRGRMVFTLQEVYTGTKVTVKTEVHRAGLRRLASAVAEYERRMRHRGDFWTQSPRR